jgi:hypothetical protein
MGWATDQVPEAQRWKAVPEIQFHWPSVLQLPVRAPQSLNLLHRAHPSPCPCPPRHLPQLPRQPLHPLAPAAEALSAGAEEEPDELEPESEPELEEPAETVMPEPPKVPPMFVANVNGCTTKESVDIRFPQAGDNVEYKGQPGCWGRGRTG